METIATIRIVLENEQGADPPPQTKETPEAPPRPPPMPDLALPPPELGLPVGPLAKEDDDLAEWEADLYRRKQTSRTASHRAAGYGPYAADPLPLQAQDDGNVVMTPFVEGAHTWVDTPVVSWYSDDDGRRHRFPVLFPSFASALLRFVGVAQKRKQSC